MSAYSDEIYYFKDEERLSHLMRSATSADFWRSLCPDLSITPEPFIRVPAAEKVPAREIERLSLQIVRDGYFQCAPIFKPADVSKLATAVSTVVSAGFHPLFAIVYDEFWGLLPGLTDILEGILGQNYSLVPDTWMWHVDASHVHAGWGPHRDNQHPDTLRTDGSPVFLNVWIPLTDVTPMNSCMYVLPLECDPNFPDHLDRRDIERVQDVRALPANAGSILGWNQYLLHWGSRASAQSGSPRISWAIYFQSGDVAPVDSLARLPTGALGFEERLAFVGSALSRYSTYFPLPFCLRAFTLATRKWLPVSQAETARLAAQS